MNGGQGTWELEQSPLIWITIVNFYSLLENELSSGEEENFQARKLVMLMMITVKMAKMIMKEKAEMVAMTNSDNSDDGNGVNGGDKEGTE